MYSYKVVKSRRKTIALQINENMELIVRAPLHCSDSRIKKMIEDNSGWIDRNMKKQQERVDNRIQLLDDDVDKLKKMASEKIYSKVRHFSEIMNADFASVKITSAKKRFGSCSGKNNLCFSYILMLYPDEAIDYVVVHELAHTFEHNHSNNFYKIIKNTLPDYKEREKLLFGSQTLPF